MTASASTGAGTRPSPRWFYRCHQPERDEIDLSTAVPLIMQAGDISIHHAGVAGSALILRKIAQLLLYQYAAVDALPHGVGDWDRFNENILRGEPTFEFRSTAMLSAAACRPPAGGGIYELQKPLQEKIFAG